MVGSTNNYKDNVLQLKCKESYDSLSLKTFQMIKMCNKYFDYDFLIKIDSSIVGYGERKKLGILKK